LKMEYKWFGGDANHGQNTIPLRRVVGGDANHG
jgi:hypothetical protein